MLRYKVCLSHDVTVGSVFGLTSHGLLAPPAPEVPAAPCVDYPTPNFWPPGSALGQNKLTSRVTHRRAAIVQDGHDVGAAIPHVSIPAFNVLTPIQVLFSKRKTAFFEPRVRFETRFAAPCSMFAMLPTPMVACADPVGLPIGSSITDQWNTVEFGMTLGSYLISCGVIWATALVEFAFKLAKLEQVGLKPDGKPTLMKEMLSKLVGSSKSKLLGGGSAREAASKLGLEAAVGIGKLAFTSGDRTASMPLPFGPVARWSLKIDDAGPSPKFTALGFSTDGSNTWSDTADRMNPASSWGADLG
jgi:hypothetical protein